MEDFLLPLADLVEELEIRTHSERAEIVKELTTSDLKRILSRQKCSQLNVESISLSEAEDLVQVLFF